MPPPSILLNEIVNAIAACVALSALSSTYAPTTGQTITVSNPSNATLIPKQQVNIVPAGTIAALTIALPAAPADGTEIQFASTQIVTALTISGGTTQGAPTTLAANGFFTLRWNAPALAWVRVA